MHGLDAKAGVLLGKMHETPALRTFTVSDPRQKSPKITADLAIAAIAVTRGAVVATGNHAHFEVIDECFPLPGIYNPFKGEWICRQEEPPDPHRP